jgi:hypothetical protein
MSTQDIQNTQETKVSLDLPVRYTEQKKRTAKSKRRLFYVFVITCIFMQTVEMSTMGFSRPFDGSTLHAWTEPSRMIAALFVIIICRLRTNRVETGKTKVFTDYADGTSTVATYANFHYFNAEERKELRLLSGGVSGNLDTYLVLALFWICIVGIGEFIGKGEVIGADNVLEIFVGAIVLFSIAAVIAVNLEKLAAKLNKKTSVSDGYMIDPEHGAFEARTLGTIGTTLLWLICAITFGAMFHRLIPTVFTEYIPFIISEYRYYTR